MTGLVAGTRVGKDEPGIHPDGEDGRLPRGRDGCRAIAEWSGGKDVDRVILEAAGRHHRALLPSLHAKGLAVPVVDPRRSRDLAGAGDPVPRSGLPRLVAWIDKAIATRDREIGKPIAGEAAHAGSCRIPVSIPGIGPAVAAALIGGRRRPRDVLFMAAMARSPGMKVLHGRPGERGKHREVALVAVMRKLIVTRCPSARWPHVARAGTGPIGGGAVPVKQALPLPVATALIGAPGRTAGPWRIAA